MHERLAGKQQENERMMQWRKNKNKEINIDGKRKEWKNSLQEWKLRKEGNKGWGIKALINESKIIK